MPENYKQPYLKRSAKKRGVKLASPEITAFQDVRLEFGEETVTSTQSVPPEVSEQQPAATWHLKPNSGVLKAINQIAAARQNDTELS